MTPHVCVVGAGVSGLRCATVLLGHSFDVTIIEARNRIGGRVCDERSKSRHGKLTSLQVAQSDHMGPLKVDM